MRISKPYLDLVATGLSESTGVKITSGNGWRYNIKSNELVYNADDLTRLKPDVVKGLLLHETGHCLFTKGGSYSRSEQEQEILNFLEDRRVESKLVDRYGDFAQYHLVALNRTFGDLWSDTSPDDYRSMSELKQALIYITTDKTHNGIMSNKVRSLLSPTITSSDDKMRALNRLDNMYYQAPNCSSLQEVYHLITTNYDEIKPLLTDKPDDKTKGKAKGNGEGDNKSKQLVSKSKDGHGLLAGHARSNSGGCDYETENYNEIKALLAPEISILTRKLKNILVENSKPSLYGRFTHGRLTSRRAVDVAIGHDRPFQHKGDYSKVDYKVRVLLDASGSMNGDKARGAYYATTLLLETSKSLDLDCRVYTFGYTTDLIADSKNPSKVQRYKADSGSTDDTQALSTMNQEISDGDNTILFIIGDGEGDSNGDIDYQFKLLNRKGVKIFSIGIGTNSLPYPNPIYADEPDKLAGIVASKIQSVIKRRLLA
jgi:hypothetical protein